MEREWRLVIVRWSGTWWQINHTISSMCEKNPTVCLYDHSINLKFVSVSTALEKLNSCRFNSIVSSKLKYYYFVSFKLFHKWMWQDYIIDHLLHFETWCQLNACSIHAALLIRHLLKWGNPQFLPLFIVLFFEVFWLMVHSIKLCLQKAEQVLQRLFKSL